MATQGEQAGGKERPAQAEVAANQGGSPPSASQADLSKMEERLSTAIREGNKRKMVEIAAPYFAAIIGLVGTMGAAWVGKPPAGPPQPPTSAPREAEPKQPEQGLRDPEQFYPTVTFDHIRGELYRIFDADKIVTVEGRNQMFEQVRVLRAHVRDEEAKPVDTALYSLANVLHLNLAWEKAKLKADLEIKKTSSSAEALHLTSVAPKEDKGPL